jgi:ribonuclease R
LTIHRLLDAYLLATGGGAGRVRGGRKSKPVLDDIPSHDQLVELGKHISFTERRSEDAERELRRVKILELLSKHIGDEFTGVVTGITNFGIFIQLKDWLIDGLIRYEDLMDDWWDVDERSGVVRGQRTGQRIGIGDVAKVIVVKVDIPRRELDLAISQITHRGGHTSSTAQHDGATAQKSKKHHKKLKHAHQNNRGGQSRRSRNRRHHRGRR